MPAQNTLSRRVFSELREGFRHLSGDPVMRVVLLTFFGWRNRSLQLLMRLDLY